MAALPTYVASEDDEKFEESQQWSLLVLDPICPFVCGFIF